MPDQHLSFICHIKQSFQIKVWVKTFSKQRCFSCCNVSTYKVMGIWNKTKSISHFRKKKNFIEKLTFPYLLHKIRQHYTRASFNNSWSVMLYNDTIKPLLALYLSDYISANVSVYIMPTLCASLILNITSYDTEFNIDSDWICCMRYRVSIIHWFPWYINVVVGCTI